MKLKFFSYFLISYTLFIYSCANQLPPSGGEDDTTPPKIFLISPKPGAVNFNKNSLTFRFDEYVDRRSFEESFFISPKPAGEVSYNWSGKEVEVEFSKPLDKNKTYVVILGNELKDTRANNKINSPLSFAFSTGNKIDEGKISGKVYADNYERVKILVYIKEGKTDEKLNPEKNLSDYVIQVSPDGSFEFNNLPNGTFRMFAITDEDRNNLYDKDLDKISSLSQDYSLTADSNEISGINFSLKDFELNPYTKEFLSDLQSDSLNLIYSNISDGDKNIPPDYKFYFYFKNNNLPKADIVNNFSITDSSNGKSYKIIFNWLNDSLLEVFSTEKFSRQSNLKIKIDLTNTSNKYLYSTGFQTAGKSNFGKLSGKIISDTQINSPVYIQLYNTGNQFISYSQKISDTTEFIFDEVLEGNYILISYIDEDNDGKPDKGNYHPFEPAEKFIFYDKEIKVKGGWNVENVFLNY